MTAPVDHRTTAQDTQVIYNDTCPVCRFEIDHYRAHALKTGAPLRFDAIKDAHRWGLTPDQAARRLHVVHRGELLSGLAAFRALWSQMPRFRWLARLTGLPVIRPVLTVIYDRIVAPLLYRAHLRRQRKALI